MLVRVTKKNYKSLRYATVMIARYGGQSIREIQEEWPLEDIQYYAKELLELKKIETKTELVPG